MKKYFCYLILLMSLCFSFTGCDSTDEESNTSKLIWENLLGNNSQYDDYSKFENLHKSEIDESGYYTNEAINMSEQNDENGKVHVSFAKHSLLNISYYLDRECANEIKETDIYLEPGSFIYYKVDKTSQIQSNTYQFQNFQLAVFHDELSNFRYDTISGDVIKIPDDIPYSEISIIPQGNYLNRVLSFDAKCSNENNEQITVPIVWIINQGEQEYYTTNETFSLEASTDFRVEAQYNPQEYYLIKDDSEPICEEKEDGHIRFQQYEAQSAVDSYKLSFGRKYHVLINSVTTNGGMITFYIDGEPNNYRPSFETYVKAGSKVTIKSTGEITSINSMHNFEKISPNEYEYTVTGNDETFVFNPADYKYENGEVEFYDRDGIRIKDKKELRIGDSIYCKGKAANGYSFNMGDAKYEIKYDSNFIYTLKYKMRFIPLERIDLQQPENGGSIIYFCNGKEISEKSIVYAEGIDMITAKFQPEQRYKTNDLSDNAECRITKKDRGVVFELKNNKGTFVDLKEVFKFSESEKANLTVKLDESVGTERKFNIYNGNDFINPNNQSYIAHSLGDDNHFWGIDENVLLKDYKIETVSGIRIKVSDGNLLNNEALKVEVNKKDNNNNTSSNTYYILSGSGDLNINTATGNNLYYNQIEIIICKVRGSIIDTNAYNIEYASVEFYYDDNNRTGINNKEFIDNTRKIIVLIRANQNYQIYKKSWGKYKPTNKDTYEIKFSYEDLDEEFADLKSEIRIQH